MAWAMCRVRDDSTRAGQHYFLAGLPKDARGGAAGRGSLAVALSAGGGGAAAASGVRRMINGERWRWIDVEVSTQHIASCLLWLVAACPSSVVMQAMARSTF
jgi:hypothetical protein